MNRLSFLLTASLAVLAAGCSPKAAETPMASAAQESAAPPPAAAAKRLPLPDCGSVQAADTGNGWDHPDCRLHSTDKVGLSFEARYTKPADGQVQKVSITVVAPGDATLQTFDVEMDGTFNAPSLQDIDGDGRDEVLVPTMTGNVNTNWSIWRAKGEETQFKKLEELSGVDIVKTPSGFIATSARSSAASWVVDFYQMDGDDLEPVVSAEVTAAGEDGKVLSVDCKIEDKGSLKDLGLDEDAARKKFCAEKVVTDIFR